MQVRTSRPAPWLTFDGSEDQSRARLLSAMTDVLIEKGFAQASVAEVVRVARVSKRTFYEHFASRDECYLAAYQAMSEALLALIRQASAGSAPAEDRLAAATYAYLGALEAMPAIARTFFTEIQLAGPLALKAQRRVHDLFADQLFTLIEEGRRELPDARPLSRAMALAVVGAANELLMKRIDEGRPDQLRDLGDTVVELIRSIMLVPDELAVPRAQRR
jgi:AcrR family transcriptional regulator